MDILTNTNNVIEYSEPIIRFGKWDDDVEKWKMCGADGALWYYAFDYGYTLHENVTLPDDFLLEKYMYVNGEFILNPDWIEPEPSDSEKIARNTSDIEELMISQADMLMELSLLEMGIL